MLDRERNGHSALSMFNRILLFEKRYCYSHVSFAFWSLQIYGQKFYIPNNCSSENGTYMHQAYYSRDLNFKIVFGKVLKIKYVKQ